MRLQVHTERSTVIRRREVRRPVPEQAIGLLALVAALLVLGACRGNTAFLTSDHAVGDSPILIVRSENGRILLNTGSAGNIHVEATIRRPTRFDFSTTRIGDHITITARATGGTASTFLSGQGPGADMELTVPAGTALDLETSNGLVQLTGVRVSGKARTSNGAIILKDAVGDFELTTSNGSIEVTDFDGTAMLRTSDGAVTITDAVGVFDVETSNGGIDFSGELAPGSASRFVTSNGGVAVALGGDPSLDLDASTSNGRVFSRLPLVPVVAEESRLVGTYGEGGTELLIRTSNGSITLE